MKSVYTATVYQIIVRDILYELLNNVCVGTIRPNNRSPLVNNVDRITSGELSGHEGRLAASNPIIVALSSVNVRDNLGRLTVSTNACSSFEMKSGKDDIDEGTSTLHLQFPWVVA